VLFWHKNGDRIPVLELIQLLEIYSVYIKMRRPINADANVKTFNKNGMPLSIVLAIQV
jgi:hypothetical protein